MLKLENISQIYAKGNEPVLKGINFEIKTGDYIALEGVSGSGKSTLLYIMAGLMRPTEGKVLWKNEDIYLMYFIILTIITCFYRESGLNSPRSYLGLDELIETINIKFQSLVKEDIEKISEENEYNFRDVKKVWERLPDAREDINSGKNDKISFVKLVLNFMQEENLIFFDEERRIISITTRFKSIVYFYFEYSKENKNRLLEYVYELGGNENATY